MGEIGPGTFHALAYLISRAVLVEGHLEVRTSSRTAGLDLGQGPDTVRKNFASLMHLGFVVGHVSSRGYLLSIYEPLLTPGPRGEPTNEHSQHGSVGP